MTIPAVFTAFALSLIFAPQRPMPTGHDSLPEWLRDKDCKLQVYDYADGKEWDTGMLIPTENENYELPDPSLPVMI